MSEATPVTIPLENVNDETVKFIAWLVEEGQEIREGQPLAEIETSKALFEMSAPASGRVWFKARPGEELPVGAVVGYIGSAESTRGESEIGDVPGPARSSIEPSAGPATGPVMAPAGTRVSKKALDLLEQHGLSPAVFAGRGMVREQDVLDYLNQGHGVGEDASDLHFALKGIAVGGVTLPAGLGDKEGGKVDPSFIDYLRANMESFAKLPSSEKCQKYREHGAVVGEGVFLGPATVIIAPRIVLGEGVRIAENSTVQCRDRFAAGPLTSFRAGLTVRGGTVVLGENVYAGSNIQIGGGGHADPWALLCVGDGTYLGDDVFINICRPVLIGKEVFLTQRSLLVTHNIGHSVLEGYENRFAPIVLEDYAQIGMNCTVYAGSSIGRAAIVASNSYVISSIPAGKLAMGVPARVIRDAARPPDRNRQVQIVEAMIRQYRELLSLKGYAVSPIEIDRTQGFTLAYAGKRFQLIFVETYLAQSLLVEPADETVIWTLEAAGASPPPACALVDLLAKTIRGVGGVFLDSSREFLRKRGIRCQPGPWRYERGLI